MKLADIMTRRVVTVGPDDTVEHIRGIFQTSHFHQVVVVESGRIVGVISDRDLLKHISPFIGNAFMERGQDVNTLRKRAHQVMHREPVIADEDMSVERATNLLLRENVACLPVIDTRGRLRGIVTWRDLLTRCLNVCPIDADDAWGVDSPSDDRPNTEAA